MREEFEAWAISVGLTLRGETGQYLKEIQCAWMAWQASRAAVVVELPKRDSEIDRDGAFYNLGVEDCRAAIESTGIRVK